jgi:hypothetical protein
MKNLIEILGGTQLLLGISFDPDVLFEERLTAEHRGLLQEALYFVAMYP